MNIHKNLEEYFPDNIKELNKLLFELDEAIKEHEDGDTNFLCNIHGNCAAIEPEEGKEDGYTSFCFFCGAELEIYKGNYYHYSSFFDMEKFKKDYTVFTTHNYEKLVFGEEPCSEEERTVFELKEKINKLKEEIQNQ